MPKHTPTTPTPVRLNAQDIANIVFIRRCLPHLHSAREAISTALGAYAAQLKREKRDAEAHEALKHGG